MRTTPDTLLACQQYCDELKDEIRHLLKTLGERESAESVLQSEQGVLVARAEHLGNVVTEYRTERDAARAQIVELKELGRRTLPILEALVALTGGPR